MCHVLQEPPKPYAFDYGVKDAYSGSHYGHKENSDGQAVKGSYQVALPDGRVQTVTYTADHYNGFQAEVSYEGSPKYPDHAPQSPYKSPPRPAYKESPQNAPPHPQEFVPSEPLPQAPVDSPAPYQPPVYQPAPSDTPLYLPQFKEEEAPVEEQVFIDPAEVPETVYRGQVDDY